MRHKRTLHVLLLGVLVAGLVGVSENASAAAQCARRNHRGGDWPVYGRDLLNTRNQKQEKVIGTDNVADLAPAWAFSVADAGGDGPIESTPMVSAGCVFIGTQTGWVFAMNADNGKLVWKRKLPNTVTTLSVAKGRVFADVSRPSAPFMVALAHKTGKVLWRSAPLTRMEGSDVTGSPVAFGTMVATGTSCLGAEGSSGEERLACRGSFVILDQRTGKILAKAYGIPEEDFKDGYAGGAMWAAPGIDMKTGYAYEGAGNPFSAREHPRTNALLKIDVRRARRTFGRVVDSYKATQEQYLPPLGTYKPLCDASGHNIGACEAPDLDMAMAANIFMSRGRKLVGAGQSSGIWHAVTANTMEYVWTTLTGPPFAGGRSGGSAYDGKQIYTAGGAPGQLWALDKDTGFAQWISPTAGFNVFNNVAYANGVVYTPSGGFGGTGRGMILAFEAETGTPLWARPMSPDIMDVASSVQAGGVSIARNTVFTPVNGLSGGYVVAYRSPQG